MLCLVSKAFINEDAEAANAAPLQPARPGKPSPITPGGHRRLQEERARILAEGDAADEAHKTRAAWLERVLGTVEVVEPSRTEDGGAGFGCAITVEDERSQKRTYVLVGPDEVDAAAGMITADSPVGRVLVGTKPGDDVEVRHSGRTQELIVVAVVIAESSK
jgi:transcription elongation GreA/GreB family factor